MSFAALRPAADETPLVSVGVARIDITPELPIRLSGYAGRPSETDRIEARLHARALAIGGDAEKPVVLLTLELIGVSDEITAAVAAALRTSHQIEPAQIALCSTHVHSGPAIRGVLPFMFGKQVPDAELARINRYTDALIGKLIEVARAALADRRPARIGWTEGRIGFAAQRRRIVDGKWVGGGGVDPNGPADHALPMLRVTDADDRIRAVFTSYACHCTAISGKDNFVHGDWAGDAAARIEARHEGSVALVALGCGADANPNPRGSIETTAVHGKALAAEVERLLGTPFRPLGNVTAASHRQVALTFDHAVTREELQGRMREFPGRPRAYAASQFMQDIDAGRPLPATVQYPVQAWMFGNELAMVFLGGEVVSEYSLRLRRELVAERLWVNAYANDVDCYIPSRRMFDEGGYEVEGAMDYYGLPTRLAIETEDQVIDAVHRIVPAEFRRLERAEP